MKIADLAKVSASRVIGIDCSTNSLAFAIFEDNEPVLCGEYTFNGDNTLARLNDAKHKTRALVEAGVLKADYIAIEASVMVRNIETALELAYVYGAVMGELSEGTKNLEKVYPISWQSGIGVPNLKSHEKEQIKKDHPGKKPSWYQNKGREIRKARILEIAKEYFDIDDDSDNVGDAVGIALHVSNVRVLTPVGK